MHEPMFHHVRSHRLHRFNPAASCCRHSCKEHTTSTQEPQPKQLRNNLSPGRSPTARLVLVAMQGMLGSLHSTTLTVVHSRSWPSCQFNMRLWPCAADKAKLTRPRPTRLDRRSFCRYQSVSTLRPVGMATTPVQGHHPSLM